jgi:hypothetical protein
LDSRSDSGAAAPGIIRDGGAHRVRSRPSSARRNPFCGFQARPNGGRVQTAPWCDHSIPRCLQNAVAICETQYRRVPPNGSRKQFFLINMQRSKYKLLLTGTLAGRLYRKWRSAQPRASCPHSSVALTFLIVISVNYFWFRPEVAGDVKFAAQSAGSRDDPAGWPGDPAALLFSPRPHWVFGASTERPRRVHANMRQLRDFTYALRGAGVLESAM